MAGQLDGSDFVALDAELWGGRTNPGGTDATSRPISTYGENRLDANLRSLMVRGEQVTYNFWASRTENPRAYATRRDRSLLWVPWLLWASLDTIEVKFFGRPVISTTSSSPKIDMRVELLDPSQSTGAGEVHRSSVTTLTHQGSSEPEVRTFTLDVSDVQFRDRTLGYVRLMFSSAFRDLNVSETPSLRSPFFHSFSGSVQHDEVWDDYNTHEVEFYHCRDNPDDTNFFMSTDRWSRQTPNGVDRQVLSSIEPLAVNISSTHTDAPVGGRIDPKSANSMRAKDPVKGQDVSGHGVNLDEEWRRQRVLAVGPHGEVADATNGWSLGGNGGNAARFKWTWRSLGTGSVDFADEKLDRQVGWIAQDEQKVQVQFLVAFFRQMEYDNGDPGAYYERPDKNGSLASLVSFGDPVFRTRVRQLQNGDTSWADATVLADRSADVAGTVKIVPHARLAFADLPDMAYWSVHPTGRGTKKAAGTLQYPFKDGMLHADDWPVAVVPVAMTVDLSSTSNPNDPVRLDLDITGWDSSTPNDPDDPYTTSDYRVVCMQTTWLSLTEP